MLKISPSILASDFSKLGIEAQKMESAGISMLHIDVMDGHFVPNLTFGAAVVEALRPHFKGVFDVHLMISQPLKYVKDFLNAGADLITFHVESESPVAETIAAIKEGGAKVGLALKPGTPVKEVLDYLKDIDLVLVMTVEPGFGGQSFMNDMLPKIGCLHEKINNSGKNIDLQVDGGINANTAKLCWEKGANVLVAGSYLFSKPDYKSAVESLTDACC